MPRRSAPWKLVMELGQGGYWDRAVIGKEKIALRANNRFNLGWWVWDFGGGKSVGRYL